MKEINELIIADGVRYAKNHEWVRPEGDSAWVGISDYAQDQLGDITFAELPAVGDTFGKGDIFGTLESTKAVADLFMPVSGEILSINTEISDSPGLVNEDPYGKGRLVEIRRTAPEEWDELMTKEAYVEMLKGLE